MPGSCNQMQFIQNGLIQNAARYSFKRKIIALELIHCREDSGLRQKQMFHRNPVFFRRISVKRVLLSVIIPVRGSHLVTDVRIQISNRHELVDFVIIPSLFARN